jgi:hypothetical protein
VNGSYRLKLSPVISARFYASQITFGKVLQIKGRRIEVQADAPSAEELAQLGEQQPATKPAAGQDGASNAAPAQQPNEPVADAGPDPSKPADIAIDAPLHGVTLSDRPKIDADERERFREIAPPGGLLVGVRVGYIDAFGGSKIGAVRPIFQNGDAYALGKPHGKDIPQPVSSVARPGYAVGAINTRTGLLLDAFQLVFMRFKEGKLDPSDSYTSSWLGDPRGGGAGTATGAGKLVVGLQGRSNGREINALGLVVAE